MSLNEETVHRKTYTSSLSGQFKGVTADRVSWYSCIIYIYLINFIGLDGFGFLQKNRCVCVSPRKKQSKS